MNISENLIRIKEGKNNIIKSLKNKGVSINDDTLINEIPTIIDNAEIGGGGDTPSQPETPELVQKYEGATVFRIEVPEDNYEFAINLCNNRTKATYDVDWGDGSLESGLTTDEQHHTYSKAGTYDVNIYNISKGITLGGYYSVNGNSANNVTYLFNNTNNDYWGNSQYIYIKDNVVTNVLIGDRITSIGQHAFESCSSLQSVVILEGVAEIQLYAFKSCSSLQSVVIPNSVTTIASGVFLNCSSLKSVVIPDSVTSIGDESFSNCSSLQSVVISDSVTSIGEKFFSNCSSLQSVVISDSVTSIGEYAFQYCSSLQSITIPESVTSIKQYAFYYCSSLQSITIPEGVTTIGTYAFLNCSSLQSVVISNSVTSIASNVFKSCSSLRSVVISNSVTSIGSEAFNYCSSLQSITIPNSVTSIGNYCFANSLYLQSITCESLTPPTISSSSFPTSGFKYTKRYLYVPKESTGYDEGNWKTYLIDKGWELRYIEDYEKTPTTLKLKTTNNFLHDFKAIGQANLVDYELVDNEYIYNFDNKITELIQYTFYNKVLEEIELPECVEILGKSAFSGSTYLNSITCKSMTSPTIQTDTFPSSIGSSVPSDTPKVLRVPEGATGYDSGNWKSYVLDKGYTLEYFKL